MDIALTRHAKIRLQQRSIPIELLDLIQDYGISIRSHGADRYYLDKEGRRQLKQSLRNSLDRKWNERCSKIYVVISDAGAVITAGFRNKRFKRNTKHYR
jgi:hypothetical protein